MLQCHGTTCGGERGAITQLLVRCLRGPLEYWKGLSATSMVSQPKCFLGRWPAAAGALCPRWKAKRGQKGERSRSLSHVADYIQRSVYSLRAQKNSLGIRCSQEKLTSGRWGKAL